MYSVEMILLLSHSLHLWLLNSFPVQQIEPKYGVNNLGIPLALYVLHHQDPSGHGGACVWPAWVCPILALLALVY